VTGPSGRLGSALVRELAARGQRALSWGRPGFDLDDPSAAERLLDRDAPGLVIHAAAWTDVDGCARDPGLAMRRNGDATDVLARACARSGARLVVVSTNEVFDGRRTDGQGYREDDSPAPLNPYGASKLAGEEAARRAFGDAGRPAGLWVVRTAWLFGPPGNDFPSRILAAAAALEPGAPLPGVIDETGSPTFAPDLATAIVELTERAPGGTYHLVNSGRATRYAWAERVIGRCRGGSPALRPISRNTFQRASTPPAWAVLDASRAAGHRIVLREWDAAFEAYAPVLCPD